MSTSAPEKPMLDVRDLKVSYGAVTAVRGIDLTVNRGECVALLGANGAGKTSTLRAVMRSIPSSGAVSFDGIGTDGVSTQDLAGRGLIHVPEGRHIYPSLTVEDQLELGKVARRGRPSTFELSDVHEFFPQLKQLRSRQGWMLSGGEQQMLAIARALLAAPKMLLLDEPSLGLAPILVKRLFAVLRDVAQTTPVLIVEQNTNAALDLVDRGLVLVRGRITLTGTAEELRSDPALLDTMLGLRDRDPARATERMSDRGPDSGQPEDTAAGLEEIQITETTN